MPSSNTQQPATGSQQLTDDNGTLSPLRVSWIGAFTWRMKFAPSVVMEQAPSVALNVEHDSVSVRVRLSPARARELAHALVVAADAAEAAPPASDEADVAAAVIDPPEVR